MKMAVKRVVNTDFWNDEKVMDLFSPEDKLFMLYLITNPHTTQLGVYAINPKHMSFELGYTSEVIHVLLERFEKNYGIIKYSYQTKEIAIKNFLRHSIVKGGKPVEDCLKKEIAQVKDKTLLQFIIVHLEHCSNLNDTVKKIVAYIKDNDNVNDNDNDNDNERYVDVSYNDSYHDSLEESDTEIEKKEINLFLTLKDGSKFPITETDIKKYQEVYTNIDVVKEIKKAILWCDSNPSNRKTKTGAKKFINGWLNRAENRKEEKAIEPASQPRKKTNTYTLENGVETSNPFVAMLERGEIVDE